MTSKNNHTGDKQQTKPSSKEYLKNYDSIFRQKAKVPPPCNHNWEYQQDKDFDWFECSKCGTTRDKTFCP